MPPLVPMPPALPHPAWILSVGPSALVFPPDQSPMGPGWPRVPISEALLDSRTLGGPHSFLNPRAFQLRASKGSAWPWSQGCCMSVVGPTRGPTVTPATIRLMTCCLNLCCLVPWARTPRPVFCTYFIGVVAELKQSVSIQCSCLYQATKWHFSTLE